MKPGRYLPAFAAALVTFVLMVLPAPANAVASAGCSVPSDLGDNTPVVLVHGFTGHPSDWGDPNTPGTMYHAIKQVPGLYVETFDWSQTNTSWVTNPGNGPRLAARVDCLAQASADNGGPGKVILIGHSMGGDMIRYAASFSLHGRLLSHEIGLVVTIGTPNLGSAWANWIDPLVATICAAPDNANPWHDAGTSFCPDYSALMGLEQNSQLISHLPWLPPSIPLRAIAGDVTLNVPLVRTTAAEDTHSDLLVGVSSALAAKHAQEPLYEGAGDSTFRCTVVIGKPLPCWHKGLLTNPAVQQKVVDSIRAYLLNGPWEQFMTGFGKWRAHGTQLTLVPEGKSTLTWSAGPCLSSHGLPSLCTGHAYLLFRPVTGGLLGTVPDSGVWFTTSSGDPASHWLSHLRGGSPQTGDTIKLVSTQYPHVLERIETGNTPGIFDGANPYFCQDGVSQELVQNGTCGA